MKYLALDFGNTLVKAAVFEKDSSFDVIQFTFQNALKELKNIFQKNEIKRVIVASVIELNAEIKALIEHIPQTVWLSHNTSVPFTNHYETPHTLGIDRIALAAAAATHFKQQDCLIIDAGTCITYDYIDKDGGYLGGAISPGITMRFKAMHDYTSKLPLLEKKADYEPLGKNTKTAMHAGVVEGVIGEITRFVDLYEGDESNLTVILTGGDMKFLSSRLKNSIFAVPNFLLKGLMAILFYHEQHT